MDIDALFTHTRDSLEKARKGVDKLFEDLRERGLSEKYGDVGKVRQSIIDAEAELDGMAAKWIEDSKSVHGESKQRSEQFILESWFYKEKEKTLKELAREQEFDFSRFMSEEE